MAITLKNYINERDLFHRPVKINVEKDFHHLKRIQREGQVYSTLAVNAPK